MMNNRKEKHAELRQTETPRKISEKVDLHANVEQAALPTVEGGE
jgi:hypothetical protein